MKEKRRPRGTAFVFDRCPNQRFENCHSLAPWRGRTSCLDHAAVACWEALGLDREGVGLELRQRRAMPCLPRRPGPKPAALDRADES